MKTRTLTSGFQTCAAALGIVVTLPAFADTVLNFDTVTPPQFHNAPITQAFGDNASSSGSGIVVTGIGTPDIDLTWGATNNPSNASSPAQRWDYYSISSEDFWRVAQLNQSRVGDAHEIKFTPANGAKVVLKSFNFYGYYPVVQAPSNSLYYQERFTYRWDVFDTNFNALVGATYSFLSNSNKDHPININYTGTGGQPLILRLTRLASTLGGSGSTANDPIQLEGDPADIGIDDITFSEETVNADPVVTVSSPANGETNSAPGFNYQAIILDGFTHQANLASVQLRLDGNVQAATVTKNGLVTTVSFAAGGLIRSGSSHTWSLSYQDNAAVSHTNQTTFTVVNFTSYEWRFTNGDLSKALGNGSMAYTGFGTAGDTSFGTTDGSTVPHINGTPAKYMHVPAFQDDSEGYLLYLSSTGPNVGTNQYVNAYTILYDVLVPGPLDWLPFFQTDPFNLNDADFYLASDGTIGIGNAYSAPVISPSIWYRIAFVLDAAANRRAYYVNGFNVGSGSGDGFGGRWSLYSNQDLDGNQQPIPQLLLFNEGDTSGVYTHELYVSSIAVADRVLSNAELSALGGPNASGILARSFTPKPTLSIQQSGANSVVSWPSNYVGYALEQTSSLTLPQWGPVGRVTNNTVNLTPSSTPTFFRLVQSQ
jgi:hypothetical protein